MSAQKTPGRLTVSRLIVRGVLGIQESTIDLSNITVISGRNSSGKSSHLAALRSAIGVDRTTLARISHLDHGVPSERPEVEVILVGDDGDREVHIRRTGDNSPVIRERVGEDWRPVPRPVEWLRDLIDTAGANPAALLAMKDEDLASAILEAMPLPAYDRSEAVKVAGLEGFRLPAVAKGLHPLEELEQIETAVAGSRTEVGREERRERDAAVRLLAGIPADAPGDVSARIGQGEQAVSALAAEITREEAEADAAEREVRAAADAAYAAQEATVSGEFKASASKLRRDHEMKAAAIRAAAERDVAADLASTEDAIGILKESSEELLDKASSVATEAGSAARAERERVRAITEGRKRDLATGREVLAGLREQQRSVDTDRHVRATAQAANDQADVHAERAAGLTKSIEALRLYKLRLASALPIPGLAVVFTESATGKLTKSLTLDGIPLAQVNDGRRAELVTEVSVLRGSTPKGTPGYGRPYLPIVLLDGIERLDPARRAALLRSVAARGSQVVAAVVGPDALRVLRDEEALAPAEAHA